MASAARKQDTTNHPGVIQGPGVASVSLGGFPAAVVGDLHSCSFPGTPPHPPSPILQGSSTVTIGGRAAARVGDKVGCGAAIVTGSGTISIGG